MIIAVMVSVVFAPSKFYNCSLKGFTCFSKRQCANTFRNEFSALKKSFQVPENQEQLKENLLVEECYPNIDFLGALEGKAFLTVGKDKYTAFVLISIPAEVLKRLVDQKFNAQTDVKENEAYKELEVRVKNDKAARAAAEIIVN
jgi:hypothetical protein